jgi:hypothetical protein
MSHLSRLPVDAPGRALCWHASFKAVEFCWDLGTRHAAMDACQEARAESLASLVFLSPVSFFFPKLLLVCK